MAKKTETADTAPATNDAYTGMLVIALLALIVGSVFLYLDYSQYPDSKGPSMLNTGFKAAPAPGGGEPKVDPKVPDPKGADPKGNPMPM